LKHNLSIKKEYRSILEKLKTKGAPVTGQEMSHLINAAQDFSLLVETLTIIEAIKEKVSKLNNFMNDM
jgi:hypothetical protein